MLATKIAVFADKDVGKKTVEFILENYPSHLLYLVLVDEFSIIHETVKRYNFSVEKLYYSRDVYSTSFEEKIRLADVSFIILAWWPFIIKSPIISLPSVGVVNFHPSYLPFNRGKNYNFWTIVEDTQFGVSLHFVDDSIDGGDIIFQKQIDKSWEDNGETLYEKAQIAMYDLFVESYVKLINNEYDRKKQNSNEGSFHYGKELEAASQIFLDEEYKAKDLLNIIRARTFSHHPGAWFVYNNEKYEVTIKIKRK